MRVQVLFLKQEGSGSFESIFRWSHLHSFISHLLSSFPGGASGKESACQCRRHKRHRFDPWVGKIPWSRKWQPLQYSCLENPMDREAWWATIHGVEKAGHDWVTKHLRAFYVLGLLTWDCKGFGGWRRREKREHYLLKCNWFQNVYSWVKTYISNHSWKIS